jgi:beta-glucanase (GH16 family)
MKRFLVAVLLIVAASLAASAALIGPAVGRAVRPAVVDACGTQPLKPDGTPWRCSFDDEFGGVSLDRTRWVPQTVFGSGTGTSFACYLDDPGTVRVAGGSLNLTVRRVSPLARCGWMTTPYVAGMVTTYHLFSQQYGRFEARVRNTATTAPGLHEAFWLWPDDRHAAPFTLFGGTGEIDISETYSVHPDLSIPYLHYPAGLLGMPVSGVNTAWNCTASRGQWNTYTLEWTPARMEIRINGKTCLVNTANNSAFQRPYILALTAGLGSYGNDYDGRAPLPATYSVDYVRVWK